MGNGPNLIRGPAFAGPVACRGLEAVYEIRSGLHVSCQTRDADIVAVLLRHISHSQLQNIEEPECILEIHWQWQDHCRPISVTGLL